MSIYITGDLHGDFSRILNNNELDNMLSKSDYLIVLGDVGLIFDARPTIRERMIIEKISRKNYSFVFISGNHDNEERLDQKPVDEWNGGNAHIIKKRKDGSPAIIHLMRGQSYNIEGKSFFSFGGAACHEKNLIVLDRKSSSYSVDKRKLDKNGSFYRIEGVDYWSRCLASEEELSEGIRQICKVGSVDYVLTHCAPTQIQTMIYNGDDTWTDVQTEYLQTILDTPNFSFKRWFFGHYHQNQEYEEGAFQCVYDDVIKL